MKPSSRIILTSCVALTSLSAAKAADDRPNIVLFYMDDMGYGDLMAHGAIGYQTPNINRLMSEGMLLTQFYSPSAVSSASRAGLMTGCYPNRVSIYGALHPNAKVSLNPMEQIIPELLATQGYRSALVGKWHLGDKALFMPLAQGFDEYYGLPYSNDMWPYADVVDPKAKRLERCKKTTPELPLYDGVQVVDYINNQSKQDALTTLYTERAVRFIEQNRNNPFFLYIPHSMPHIPLGVSDKFRGKSEIGTYGDVMMEIDWSIGEVMRVLRENGLEHNTLVVITSDNGPWINYGDHAGSTGALREGKMTSFEGGQHVPCVMRWPAVIPAGSISNKLACAIDLLPTFCDMSGARLPKQKIDGVSLMPLLRGQSGAAPRKTLCYYYGDNNLRAIRDHRFKLIFAHDSRTYEPSPPGNGGYKNSMGTVQIPQSLYDLRRDAGERYDVSSQHPDVVERLMQQANIVRGEIGDKLTSTVGTMQRPAASSEM